MSPHVPDIVSRDRALPVLPWHLAFLGRSPYNQGHFWGLLAGSNQDRNSNPATWGQSSEYKTTYRIALPGRPASLASNCTHLLSCFRSRGPHRWQRVTKSFRKNNCNSSAHCIEDLYFCKQTNSEHLDLLHVYFRLTGLDSVLLPILAFGTGVSLPRPFFLPNPVQLRMSPSELSQCLGFGY
jgi:hypothetical protein